MLMIHLVRELGLILLVIDWDGVRRVGWKIS
jgi:hypothetical protein